MGWTNVTIKQGKINDKPPAIIYTLQYIALVIDCNSINEVFSKLNQSDSFDCHFCPQTLSWLTPFYPICLWL